MLADGDARQHLDANAPLEQLVENEQSFHVRLLIGRMQDRSIESPDTAWGKTRMGNLGGYQTITTVVKNLGGPAKATVIVGSVVATGGYAVLRCAEAGAKKVVKASKAALAKRNAPCPTKGQVFEVVSDGEDGSGLRLSAGDKYRVMECDGDAVQIEVLGGAGNPYFVSAGFLRSVSGFPAEDTDSTNDQ